MKKGRRHINCLHIQEHSWCATCTGACVSPPITVRMQHDHVRRAKEHAGRHRLQCSMPTITVHATGRRYIPVWPSSHMCIVQLSKDHLCYGRKATTCRERGLRDTMMDNGARCDRPHEWRQRCEGCGLRRLAGADLRRRCGW